MSDEKTPEEIIKECRQDVEKMQEKFAAEAELKAYRDNLSKKRRSFAVARAIIQRGKSAGIPDKYIRVKKPDFESVLCRSFHGDTKNLADSIYKSPSLLFEKPFIIIDGGDPDSRKLAGYAILFRMIACDKYGLSYDCGQLSSEFQTIRNQGENRNDLVARLKKQGVLFINEFHPRKFNIHLPDSANFFDQLLGERSDYSRPTILTFSSPLERGVTNLGNAIKDDRCGLYLSMLSHADVKNNQKVFRIRVK
jgi:hypothetical protein